VKPKKQIPWDEATRQDDVLVATDADEFEIGQCYENHPAKRLECKKCGSKQFIVGAGNYYTALKCPTCKWECCVHEG